MTILRAPALVLWTLALVGCLYNTGRDERVAGSVPTNAAASTLSGLDASTFIGVAPTGGRNLHRLV